MESKLTPDSASEVELARQRAAEVGALIDTALVSLSTGLRQLQSAEKGLAAFIPLG